MSEENEMVKSNVLENFAISKFTSEDLKTAISSNFSGEKITARDLERIRVPSQGGKSWTIQGLDGEELHKTINGIILRVQPGRVYWQNDITEGGGGNPPDCASQDGLVGLGEPGGVCAKCPFDQFGSRGDGKACKELRMLFILRENSIMPSILVLPPTSIFNLKRYFVALTGNAKPFFSVLTEIGLTEATSNSGIKYSQTTFRAARILSQKEAVFIQEYKENISGMLSTNVESVSNEVNNGN